MSEFIRKVLFNKTGGNASKNACSYKISLPAKVIDVLGVNEEKREVVIETRKDHIIIRRFKETFALNGYEVQEGDFYRLYEYDTIVDESVSTYMFENIEDKGEYFEIALSCEVSETDIPEGYIVYANLYKKDLMAHAGYKEIKDSNPNLNDWEVFYQFFYDWGSCSSFWDIYVEISKIESY